MKDATTLMRVLAPIAMSLVVGCAPAYHRYSGNHVHCHYCQPPPLPYARYNKCVCHSRAAQPYLHAATAASEQADSGARP